jgi:hypothetical protein
MRRSSEPRAKHDVDYLFKRILSTTPIQFISCDLRHATVRNTTTTCMENYITGTVTYPNPRRDADLVPGEKPNT